MQRSAFVLLLATGCATQPAKTAHELRGEEPTVEPAAEPPAVSVSLTREACYGSCPVYTVTLHGDGTVTWLGEEFVEHVGRARGTYDVAELASVIDALAEVELRCVRLGRRRVARRADRHPAVLPGLTWQLSATRSSAAPADTPRARTGPCRARSRSRS